MDKPKIVVTVRDGVVENVFSNIREDIEIDVEISYPEQLTSYENLDAEIERKQKGLEKSINEMTILLFWKEVI